MFLLSTKVLKLLKFCIKFSEFLRVIPYKWNEANNRIQLVSNTVNRYSVHWESVRNFLLIHQIFIFVRLVQSIAGGHNGYALYIMQVAYFAVSLVVSLCQILITHRKIEVLVFINRFLQFCEHIEGKFYGFMRFSNFYPKIAHTVFIFSETYELDGTSSKLPDWEWLYRVVVTFLFSVLNAGSIGLYTVMLKLPESEVFMTSVIDWSSCSRITILIMASHIFPLAVASCAAVVGTCSFFMLYVCILMATLKELK